MAREIKAIIEQEIRKFKHNWGWYLLGTLLFLVLPYVNYYWLDGNVYNRVLTYNNGVDPMAMETDKTAYCPGEELWVYTSFCKNRTVEGYDTTWYQSNGHLQLVRSEVGVKRVLPEGCYPIDNNEVTLSKRFTIPENTKEGWHTGYGVTTHYLSGNRPRTQEYATEPYYVLNANKCKPEDIVDRMSETDINIISVDHKLEQ